MSDRLFIGLGGLVTDMQTMYQKLKMRVNLYTLREEREIEPKTFSNLVSTMLYEKRYVNSHLIPFDLILFITFILNIIIASARTSSSL